MSSIIESYNYDIFISYRQKDNKGERWVSEFVEALRTELESTFKENISIYFDENPHDGLLETHDVDASLKEKLKCLIFIPVISRTYCDPKAFAWEHEFKAFVEIASNDQFGLKVTLPNGNVGTRVLPVRIHELDREDIYLCESLLGGVLRGVDFIYKVPGVNRPLRAGEDHPKDNLNKTYYRDQINKVANAINDIIHGLRNDRVIGSEKLNRESDTGNGNTKRMAAGLKAFVNKKLNIRKLLFFFLFVLCLSGIYIAYKSLYLKNIQKTIAILPLVNVNSDNSLNNDETSFTAGICNKLLKVKNVIVIPNITTEQYRNSGKSAKSIWNELKTDYVLDGKIQREKSEIIIWVQLSERKNNKVIWAKPITWNRDHFSQISLENTKSILGYMGVALTPAEEKLISAEPLITQENNLRLVKANKIVKDAWSYFNYSGTKLDTSSYMEAIVSYNKIISDNPSYAEAYAKRSIARSWGYSVKQLDSTCIPLCKKDFEKAISLDSNLNEAEIAKGFYYYYCKDSLEMALECFDKASANDPGNYLPLFYKALVLRRMGKWDESQILIRRTITFDVNEPLFLTNIGLSYVYLHKYDSAIIFHQKAIDLMPGWASPYKNKFDALILKGGRTSDAAATLDEAVRKTGNNLVEYYILLSMYNGSYPEALNLAKIADRNDFFFKGMKFIYLGKLSTAMNRPADAENFYDTASIMLERDLQKYPRESILRGLLGIAYAGLGRKADASSEGNKSVEFAAKKNMMDECDSRLYLAQIFVMNRDYHNAIPCIAKLLNNPSMLSERMLHIDPVWKPLMDQPEYRKKIRNYSKN